MRKLENNELERKTIEDFKLSEKTPLILILDDVRSFNRKNLFVWYYRNTTS